MRVAWLYFMEGLTQADIATRLGITRLRVNRLLAEARTNGLVSIQVNSRLSDCVALEHALVAETGLKDAVIVPTPTTPTLSRRMLGQATADYLSRHLERTARGPRRRLGRDPARDHPPRGQRNLRDLSINSMMGGLTQGSELNTFEIASELARRVNAQCNYLAAPIYSGSPKSRDTILAQDVFRETFERTRRDRRRGAERRRSQPPLAADPLWLAARRLGRIAARGRRGRRHHGHVPRRRGPADRHPLNQRVIALPIDKLRKIDPSSSPRAA